MNLEQARFNMVEQQIRTWEVLDPDVLDLLYVVRREEFVPPAYRELAFSDLEIPLRENAGEGERMMQPKIEARILQELAPKKSERVLEVGTGSGYMCALLAARAHHVHSVEIDAGLKAFGEGNLRRAGVENVTLDLGDAARGWTKLSSMPRSFRIFWATTQNGIAFRPIFHMDPTALTSTCWPSPVTNW
jgi:protein-L-isoaspartate(D-aspartate) O-methyltransferase